MQVALQPLPLLLPRLQNARTRSLNLLETSGELGMQAPVLERDSRSGGDSLEKLRLVVEGRGVGERRPPHPLPHEHGDSTGWVALPEPDEAAGPPRRGSQP